MRKNRILFVIDGLEFGGGERVFLQLAAELRNHFEVFAAAMPGRNFEKKLREFGIRFYPVDMSRQLSLKPIRQLKNIVDNQKIDILHSQGARADFFARVAGGMHEDSHLLCTIATIVEGFDISPFRKKVYRLFDRFTERWVEKFIVVSDSLKSTLTEKRGIPASKVVRIHNGIELKEYRPGICEDTLRDKWRISKELPLIGAIGRMVWEKGFEYLIEAVPVIIKTFPEAKILLVGDGPLLDGLKALSGRLGVEKNIIFAGFQSDIKEILSAFDLLVVPSLLEGFPMVTLEAMAMAKPIIATNIDGITEQITNGENGILVPPKDPDALAKAIIKVLSDGKSSKAMGLAARKKVEQEFSVEKMVAETEKVYLSLLKAS